MGASVLQVSRTNSTVDADAEFASTSMSVHANQAEPCGSTEENCCVCDSSTFSRTPCGHVLCMECHMELRKPSCPICRRELPSNGREQDSDSDSDDGLVFGRRNALVSREPSPTGMGSVRIVDWRRLHRLDDEGELVMDRRNAYRSDVAQDRAHLPQLHTARDHFSEPRSQRRCLFGNIRDRVRRWSR